MLLATPRGHDEAAMVDTWCKIAVVHYALHRTINAARHHPAWSGAAMAERALEQAMIEAV